MCEGKETTGETDTSQWRVPFELESLRMCFLHPTVEWASRNGAVFTNPLGWLVGKPYKRSIARTSRNRIRRNRILPRRAAFTHTARLKAAHSDTTYDWPDVRLGRMGVGGIVPT